MEFLNIIALPVWFAMAGAFAVKLLELAEIHKLSPAERPDLKDFFYWVPFFILPMLGGGLAQVYVSSNTELSPILAVNIGVSAPLMLRSMAQTIPDKLLDTPQNA